MVESRPKSFYYFPVHLPSALNEVKGVFIEALQDMGTQMELPHCKYEFQLIGDIQIRALVNTLEKLNTPLTSNIVDDLLFLDAFAFIVHGLNN